MNCTANDLPITHLYQPANVYGVVNNHDYLEKSPADLFLESLNVTSYTKEQCQAIKEKTRGQSGKKFWGEERLLRLQSSNYGWICKSTDRADKKKARSLAVQNNFARDAWKKYEGLAIDAYAKRLNVSVEFCVSRDTPF